MRTGAVFASGPERTVSTGSLRPATFSTTARETLPLVGPQRHHRVDDATVRFYGGLLGLEPLRNHLPHVGFDFGGKQLWIDPSRAQPGRGLAEIVTGGLAAAAAHFERAGVVRCDEIEPLPQGHQGFWIMGPATFVLHLGAQSGEW